MEGLQEAYKQSLEFAASKHEGQQLPGTQLPYLVHVTSVAMEVMLAGFNTFGFNLPFAVSVALLHDTLEDTQTTYEEVKRNFNEEVATAVLALTKFSNIPKNDQIKDSLMRIKRLTPEVWAVKMADRITNLSAPPLEWDYKKRRRYLNDAEMIHNELKGGNNYLAQRLTAKINDYQQFVLIGEK